MFYIIHDTVWDKNIFSIQLSMEDAKRVRKVLLGQIKELRKKTPIHFRSAVKHSIFRGIININNIPYYKINITYFQKAMLQDILII